jgi:hypothetical protein
MTVKLKGEVEPYFQGAQDGSAEGGDEAEEQAE